MNEQDVFTIRLKRLFDEKTKPDGSKYTQTDVMKGTNNAVDRVYLWKLLSGRATKPNIQIVQALADFFQVDPNYFFESTKNVPPITNPDPSAELYAALRAFGLDKDEQEAITSMIEVLAKTKTKKKE